MTKRRRPKRLSPPAAGSALVRMRSQWHEVDAPVELRDVDPQAQAFMRRVHDGTLQAFVAVEVGMLHVSIAHVDHQGRPGRYPIWDEIMDFKLVAGIDQHMVMHLPTTEEYVDVHRTTFHLWQLPNAEPQEAS